MSWNKSTIFLLKTLTESEEQKNIFIKFDQST